MKNKKRGIPIVSLILLLLLLLATTAASGWLFKTGLRDAMVSQTDIVTSGDVVLSAEDTAELERIAGQEAEFTALESFLRENAKLPAIVLAGGFALFAMLLFILSASRSRAVAEVQDSSAIQEEYFNLVSNDAHIMLFDADVRSKTVECNDTFKTVFGRSLAYDELVTGSTIHDEDREKFRAMLDSARSGQRSVSNYMRIKKSGEQYVWCQVVLNVITGGRKKPLRVLGKISDIDRAQRDADTAASEAQVDRTTQLSGAGATLELVRSRIEQPHNGKVHGLAIINIDNFSSINENYSYACGDMVLYAVAEKLRSMFRSTDIIGRIGGDEFMVFLNNVNSPAKLESLASSIVCGVAEIKFDWYKDKSSITCSLGSAVCDENDHDFDELYKRADIALHYAKQQGRNSYALYSPSMGEARQKRTAFAQHGIGFAKVGGSSASKS